MFGYVGRSGKGLTLLRLHFGAGLVFGESQKRHVGLVAWCSAKPKHMQLADNLCLELVQEALGRGSAYSWSMCIRTNIQVLKGCMHIAQGVRLPLYH